MASFQTHYERYMDQILEMPSGTHPVDPERLAQWIEAQHSEERQETARALASQIQYITHHEVIALCEKLVDELYAALDHSKPVVWWVGVPEKSGYMISLLCYHALKRKRYPEPSGFLGNATGFETGTQYIYFDDMSYSGSQIKDVMNSIIRQYTLDGNKFPLIYFGLMSITEYALNSLQTLKPVDHITLDKYTKALEGRTADERLIPSYLLGTTRVMNYSIPNPFRCFHGKLIPSLKRMIGELNYNRAMLYFDGEHSQVDSIVYFDHKVADSVSTFMKVLLYGIVPPYNFSPYGVYIDGIPNLSNKDLYMETFPRDPADKEVFSFVPFLRGCMPNNDTLNIWSRLFSCDMEYEESAYFVKDGKRIRDGTLLKEGASILTHLFYRQYNDMIKTIGEIEKWGPTDKTVQSVQKKLHPSGDVPIGELLRAHIPDWDDVLKRCPISWYKGYFRGGRHKTRLMKRRAKKGRATTKRRSMKRKI
jgi:hypothetical protein